MSMYYGLSNVTWCGSKTNYKLKNIL